VLALPWLYPEVHGDLRLDIIPREAVRRRPLDLPSNMAWSNGPPPKERRTMPDWAGEDDCDEWLGRWLADRWSCEYSWPG
jgi:hypothetical protein